MSSERDRADHADHADPGDTRRSVEDIAGRQFVAPDEAPVAFHVAAANDEAVLVGVDAGPVDVVFQVPGFASSEDLERATADAVLDRVLDLVADACDDTAGADGSHPTPMTDGEDDGPEDSGCGSESAVLASDDADHKYATGTDADNGEV